MDEIECHNQNKNVKMGADGHSNTNSRIVILQARKQALEEKILLKNQELKRLCIQEAELTGIMPAEIPLEPGEQIPVFRRRIGTTFEYPQNLINKLNNEEKSIPTLETEIQVQRHIAEAALQLANNSTISKSVKRKNWTLYQQTKQHIISIEERLEHLKSQANSIQLQSLQNQQLKQKKKPRPPLESEYNLNKNSSYSTQSDDSKSNHLLYYNSACSDQTHFVNTEVDSERYTPNRYGKMSRNTEAYLSERNLQNSNFPNYNPEEMTATLNRLSVNSYNRWNNGNSNNNNVYLQQTYTHSTNQNIYPQQTQHSMHILPPGNHMQNYLQNHSHSNVTYPYYAQTLQHSSSRNRSHVTDSRKYATMENTKKDKQDSQLRYSPNMIPLYISPKSYKHLAEMNSPLNPPNLSNVLSSHHVPPHHSYDSEVSSAGLGGHWMKTETEEFIWCPVVSHADLPKSCQHEKRFGSLDRRKGKRGNNQSTCLENVKYPVVKMLSNSHWESTMQMSQTIDRTSSGRQNYQLVRAQSLGSVGIQTTDNTWPSDDNSSCDSDGHSISMNSRKIKQKDWYETSLDTLSSEAVVQITPILHQTTVQDDNFSVQSINTSHTLLLSPYTLEIPAESNPSPMIAESNIEIFNNNVLTDLPKNCTVVQAGVCKPYREVTKPFEMSDFYKYSTKFREKKEKDVPQDGGSDKNNKNMAQNSEGIDGAERTDVVHKTIYQPLEPLKCQPYALNNGEINRSTLNFGNSKVENKSLHTTLGLLTSNVAENFSSEMNIWYESHGHTPLSKSSLNSLSVGRTGTTLV